jgi:hypothetical protein
MGNRMFGAAKSSPATGIASTTSIAAADVDQDGKVDVVVGSSSTSVVGLLLGNKDGTFQAPKQRTVAGQVGSVALVDMDGDGVRDLVATSRSTNNISICTGNKAAAFSFNTCVNTTAVVGASAPLGMAIADIDADGKPDVVTANSTSQSVSVYINNAGTLAAPTTYYLGYNPESVVAVDIDGDGLRDLITSNPAAVAANPANVSYLQGQKNVQFALPLHFTTPAGPSGLVVANLNADKLPDIVTTSASTNNLEVFVQQCN